MEIKNDKTTQNNKRHNYEDVKKNFDRKGYTLVSKEYKNQKEKLDYICNKHKETGIQRVSYASFKKNIHNCKECRKENAVGKTHNVPKQIDSAKHQISHACADAVTVAFGST